MTGSISAPCLGSQNAIRDTIFSLVELHIVNHQSCILFNHRDQFPLAYPRDSSVKPPHNFLPIEPTSDMVVILFKDSLPLLL